MPAIFHLKSLKLHSIIIRAICDNRKMKCLVPPGSEILTPAEMGEADACAIASGMPGIQLMEAAGHAVKDVLLRHYPAMRRAVILCGPGNNGGDGYVVAILLKNLGIPVEVYADRMPRGGSDAAIAARRWQGGVAPLATLVLQPGDLVIDALYGAGFKGKLEGVEAEAAGKTAASGMPVISIDLPSGVDGNSGHVSGAAFRADRTVTFFRKKPGHLLYPGRDYCGTLDVADIGIPARVLDATPIGLCENDPCVFRGLLPAQAATVHKYGRGSVGVFTGEAASTGAARLAAIAAQRAGAGAVTLIAPEEAIGVLSAHVTAAMIRAAGTVSDLYPLLGGGKFTAFIIGPGFGRFRSLKDFVLTLLEPRRAKPVILDADVFSAFAFEGGQLFAAIKASGRPVILTPHEGEFARIFPDLSEDGSLAKHEKARKAASRSGAIVVLKGPDTVIAAPDGRAAINSNGVPGLATAGSGDVLAGFAGGLLSQGTAAFEAACAAVWYHADAGSKLDGGFTAEDLAARI
jgi:hydroxyethylthiazole kinase-like uncharacterized protein yjeF